LGKEKWSPDAAIGYAKANKLFPGKAFTTRTFYNWVDDGLDRVKSVDLLLRVRRRASRPRHERKKKPGKSIEERSAAAATREEFGHWEGDRIIGKGQQGHLITLVERKQGISMLFNAGNKARDHIVEILDGLQQRYGKRFPAIFKTITFDNGPEFSDSPAMERYHRTQVYYAHPYSSFELGANENWNRIVRRFVSKRSSFDCLTGQDMQRNANYINTLPRRRYGYKTPMELWHAELDAILSA